MHFTESARKDKEKMQFFISSSPEMLVNFSDDCFESNSLL